jgi:formamidopyrimidine-DNA glycosylase
MPELPEVETVKRTLELKILNLEIKNVEVYYDNIMPDAKMINLNGEKIIGLERVGKFLIFKLTNHVIVSHMRMEGRFFLKEDIEPKTKHEHVKITFTNNLSLRYVDTRKFGRLLIKTPDNYLNTPPLSQVAKEPHQIKPNEFYEVLQRRSRAIKSTLLDQQVIAGLGNIYVDETLFMAQVLPTRKSNLITLEETKKILDAASQVLKKATKLGGTTIYTYESSEGVTGRFQNELLVHTKVGEPCPVCGHTIEKIKVGGRGTYVCFKCQK